MLVRCSIFDLEGHRLCINAFLSELGLGGTFQFYDKLIFINMRRGNASGGFAEVFGFGGKEARRG
jgi:hypothetical protein